jgi:ribonucleoside-triphosphate reductase
MTEIKAQKEQELITSCPRCDSENVYGITRVTGYFSKTSMWNKGKIAELKDREREANKKYFSQK